MNGKKFKIFTIYPASDMGFMGLAFSKTACGIFLFTVHFLSPANGNLAGEFQVTISNQ